MAAPAQTCKTGPALLCLVLCECGFFTVPAHGFMSNPHDKFWAFSDDGITVIGTSSILGTETSRPSDKPVDRVLAAQTKGSLCNGEDCGWRHPMATGLGHVIVPNYKSSHVVVFEVEEGNVLANVPTCKSPFRVDVAAWRKEVYVHCGDGNVDTLNMGNWAMKQPLVKAVSTSSKLVQGTIVLNEALQEHAWTSNSADPGYHKIHLESRTIQFVDLQSEGCEIASDLAISGCNHHGFIRCSSSGGTPFVLEINLEDDKVVKKMDIPGHPFVSKSGQSIVIVDDQQNKLHMLKAMSTGQPSELEAIVDGIEGFSQLEFVSYDESDVNVAVASSSTQYKVLLVDMNNYANTEIVEYHESQNRPALDEGQGSLAATYVDSSSSFLNDRVVIAVSAQELNSTFLISFKVGKDVPSLPFVPWETKKTEIVDVPEGTNGCDGSWGNKCEKEVTVSQPIEITLQIEQVQGFQGDSMKVIYVGEPDTDTPLPTVLRNVASVDALERLGAKIAALQKSLWGADLSDSFRGSVPEEEPSKGSLEIVGQKIGEAEAEAEQMKQQLIGLSSAMEQNKQQAGTEREAAARELEAAAKEREAAAKERKELEEQLSIFKAAMEQNKQLASDERQAATQEREAASRLRQQLQSSISSNEISIDTARKVAIAGVVLASVAAVGIMALAVVMIVGVMRQPQLATSENTQACQGNTGKLGKAIHDPKLDTMSLASTEFGEDCRVKIEV